MIQNPTFHTREELLSAAKLRYPELEIDELGQLAFGGYVETSQGFVWSSEYFATEEGNE